MESGTEQEIFSLDELCEAFTLDRVHKSGAKFNPDKTKWFNQQYIQKKSNSELASLFSSILREKEISVETNYVEKVVSLIKERATFVSEFWSLSDFFFVTPTQYDPKAAKKNWKEGTSELMQELMNIIALIDEFTSEEVEDSIKKWILSKEIGFGRIMQPLRLSLVGAMKGPHLFDIIEMIGKTETLRRIKNAIENIQKNGPL